jgi:hypothetical protein
VLIIQIANPDVDVTRYILQASSKAKQSEDKRFESLDKKGTGGTSK